MIESVQRRATKQIPGLSKLSYPERLKKLSLPTLSYRRVRSDMIEMYKITHGVYDEEVQFIDYWSDMSARHSTRSNSLKIFQPFVKTTVRRHSFRIRAAKVWNDLPESVVQAPSMNAFKNRLDKHWSHQPLLHDYRAPLTNRQVTRAPEVETDRATSRQIFESAQEAS